MPNNQTLQAWMMAKHLRTDLNEAVYKFAFAGGAEKRNVIYNSYDDFVKTMLKVESIL